MISDAYCEKALRYMADTDAKAAELKVEVMRIEDKISALRSAIFTRTEGSVEARKAIAENAMEVVAEREKLYAALLEFETIKAKRNRAERTIEIWRSINSNRRAGIIT